MASQITKRPQVRSSRVVINMALITIEQIGSRGTNGIYKTDMGLSDTKEDSVVHESVVVIESSNHSGSPRTILTLYFWGSWHCS